MADRLTQLQICLDQMVEQMSASLNHVIGEGKGEVGEGTLEELSTDLILKTRQVVTLIDALPGVGVSPESQMGRIEGLRAELEEVEAKRVEAEKVKEELGRWVDALVVGTAGDMAASRLQ